MPVLHKNDVWPLASPHSKARSGDKQKALCFQRALFEFGLVAGTGFEPATFGL